jgi:hypothetical protein
MIGFQLQWALRNTQEILEGISTGTLIKPTNPSLITKDNSKLRVIHTRVGVGKLFACEKRHEKNARKYPRVAGSSRK